MRLDFASSEVLQINIQFCKFKINKIMALQYLVLVHAWLSVHVNESKLIILQELPRGYGRVKPDIVTYGSSVRGSALR